jgi:DNA-binding MarR family transcriptional regulator
MSKMSDTQLVILSHGAKRKDGAILPLPRSLKSTDKTVATTLKSLLKKGFVAERPTQRRTVFWRETEDGHRFMLVVTPEGLKAIGVEPENVTRAVANDTPARLPKAGTKQAKLVELMARPRGATIPQLQKATGWLPHTTRAALTGLRKRGFDVIRQKQDDGPSVYRIAAGP